MAVTMPAFLTRLFRPLSSSTRMGVGADGGATATAPLPDGAELATVAAGCFWGVEHLFRKTFAGKGLLDARVGYIGGDTQSPSYRSVCSGRTGRMSSIPSLSGGRGADDGRPDAEALQITFDPTQVSYRDLLLFFYKMHDPTTKDRQGGDAGTQYRSGIFTHGPEQEKVARDVTEQVQKEWWRAGKITTQIIRESSDVILRWPNDRLTTAAAAGQWWDAEAYHQLYLDKNPGGYECPAQ